MDGKLSQAQADQYWKDGCLHPIPVMKGAKGDSYFYEKAT